MCKSLTNDIVDVDDIDDDIFLSEDNKINE